jgi:hypothetical protein
MFLKLCYFFHRLVFGALYRSQIYIHANILCLLRVIIIIIIIDVVAYVLLTLGHSSA